MPEKVSIEEAITFNYWAVTLRLLELGVPWEQIQDLSAIEVSIILGLKTAFEQRKSELEMHKIDKQHMLGGFGNG